MSQTEQMVFHQRIRLPYRYSPGPAQRAALEGFAAGVLRGSRCDTCQITLAPARPYCPRCTGRTGAVVDLSDVGTLQGWTTRNHGATASTFGMVRLDGADTALLHRVEATADQLVVGLRVRARWNGERQGEVTDVDCFVPVPD